MKLLAPLFILLLTAGAENLRADDPVTVSVRCLGNQSPVLPTPSLHVFGGGSLSFLVAVDAPLGSRLQLRADVLQTTAGSLAVPLKKDVPLSEELPFESRTHLTVTCTLPSLPTVQRVSRTLLTLRAVAPDRAALLPAVPMEVFLYPPEVPGEWKKTIAARLARSGLSRLEVFGKGTGLRRFLKARRVEFEDGGADWPARLDPRTLYIGDEPASLPARLGSTEGGWLLLFQPPEASTLLPGVYQNFPSTAGNIVKVTLPDVLTRLEDDPRSQETLAEIFRRALEPRTPAAAPNLTPP